MRPRNRVSSAGMDLVKRFEGYRRQAAQLPDGRWTIGYGHTLTAREGAEVSEEDAESLLIYDLQGAAKTVNELVFTPLNQNQFDALSSFVFNLGPDAFRRSEVLKRLNEGGIVQAACAMELWRKAEFEGEDIVVDALVRRRAAEKVLFLTPPDEAFVPAPSPVLRPKVDPRAGSLVPADPPTELATSLYGASVIVTRPTARPPAPPPELPTLPPEPPEPVVDRVTAAAEAVTSRLETLFAEAPEREDEHEGFVEAVIDEDPEDEFCPPPLPASEAEVEPEPEPEVLGEPEPVSRDEDEDAFIEAFIEAPEPEVPFLPDAAPPEPEPAPPEPGMTRQTITPIVMSYPAAPTTGASAFQPSFTAQPAVVAPEPPRAEMEPPTPEPEPELEPEPAAAIEDEGDAEPPLSFEPPDSDLWGDDAYEPTPGSPAIAEDEGEELELAPAAEAPPLRADDEYDLDAFIRRPQPEPGPPPVDPPRVAVETAPVRDFLPKRAPREQRPREPGLLTDLFLALLGIAFFGFAVFWALNAKVDPTGPGVHPSLVAWPTGFIGIGFVVVAIFRLLERLGDAAERD